MMDIKAINNKSTNFESQVRGIFKKYNLLIKKLDKNKNGSRPDFFVQTKDKKFGFICECKYIASAGTIDNGLYNVSTDDLKLFNRNKGVFKFN